MNLAQEKLDLIEKLIRSDRKFAGNEDLYDDFFNETCKRSVAIINTIDNDATLETYLRRIVTTSVVTVLKDSGRLRRARNGYMSTGEYSFASPDLVDYSAYEVNYANIEVPQGPEEMAIQNEVLEFVAEAIKKIDFENPDKMYMELYTMRYAQGLTQKQIAEELNVSQSEVSKRLFKLIDKVKEIIG